MSDFSTLAQAGGTLFAAGAAGASWLSVAGSQREARERRVPYLEASPLPIVGTKATDRGAVNLEILNAGKGVASGIAFVLAVGDDAFCSNGAGGGFLPYGGLISVKTDMRPHDKIRALVMCRDIDRRIWVNDLHGRRKSYTSSKLDSARDFEVFWSDFYRETLEGRQRHGSRVDVTFPS